MSFYSANNSLNGLFEQIQETELGKTLMVSTRVASYGTISRLSYQTPSYGFKKLVGKLPENTFRFTEVQTTNNNGVVMSLQRFTQTRYIKVTQTGIFGTPSLAPPFSEAIIQFNQSNLVKAAVMSKIKDMELDLAVFAGESREMRDMFVKTGQVILRAFKAAKRGDMFGVRFELGLSDYKSFARGSKSISDIWLLLNYGVRPLVSDLQSALKVYEKGLAKERFTVVSSRNEYRDVSRIVKPFETYGVETQIWDYRLDTSVRVKYQVSDVPIVTLTSLGLTNPFVVGWELTKLSFVFDWLIGVGDWLSALDASLGKTFIAGSVTQFTKISLVGNQTILKKPGYVYFRRNTNFGYERVTCNREQLTSFPIAYLPGVKDKIGLFHVATTVALLRQRLH